MPKCPFCGKEIEYLHSWYQEVTRYRVSLDENGDLQWEQDFVSDSEALETGVCPHCERHIPIYDDTEEFLKEKYVILRPDDPEIKRKGDFALFRGRVYKIDKFYFLEPFLVLELVEDELVADILKADLEGEKDA